MRISDWSSDVCSSDLSDEDLAMSLGLKGARTTEGDIIYFGLVGTNLVDGIEQIPFFANERQQYLEYDVTRLIQNLSRSEERRVGKAWVRTFRSRWSAYHYKKKIRTRDSNSNLQ